MPEDEHPEAPRREVAYALLALVGVLIGISRLVGAAEAPLWVKALDASISAAFLGDWLRRIAEAPRRGRYALRHAWEVVTFIPFTLLPATVAGGDVLRGVRLLRALRFMRYGRYVKVGLALARLPRRARHLQRIARHAQVVNLLLVGLLVVSFGAVLLLVFEGAAAGLHAYSAAFWWSLNLFATTAYAVPQPTSPAGFLVAGALMLSGVAYIGVFTASLASAILKTRGDEDEA